MLAGDVLRRYPPAARGEGVDGSPGPLCGAVIWQIVGIRTRIQEDSPWCSGGVEGYWHSPWCGPDLRPTHQDRASSGGKE